MPNPLELLFTVVAGVGQLVGFRAGTEQPVYAVVEQHGAVEIRRYKPRIVAETTVEGDVMDARNEGFRRIAGYIFGGNTTKASIAMTAPVVQAAAPAQPPGKGAPQTIAMTAPVVQARDADGWRVQFVMPARYTMANLPAPNDARVRIVQAPAQDYAVLRFSGSRSGAAVDKRTAELNAGLAGAGWRVSGAPVAWFYDPPWTAPFLRRNEVATPVERAG